LFLCEIANKIAYANPQGYVYYHRLLVKIHQNIQNRYNGNKFVVDQLVFRFFLPVSVDNKMRLLIRLEPKAYFTFYISQI
jgi:hypothetical protein